MKKIFISIFIFCALLSSFSNTFAQTKTVIVTKDLESVNPKDLNWQRQKYPVIEIQLPYDKGWSDIEIKASITNFSNSLITSGKLAVTNAATYTNKITWDAMNEIDRNNWLNNNVTGSARPSNWESMDAFEKDVWLTAHYGQYIFFFGTSITYDTHYIFGKNDGELKIYFTASTWQNKELSAHDPRTYVEYIVPKLNDKLVSTSRDLGKTPYTSNSSNGRDIKGFGYITTGTEGSNLSISANTSGLEYYKTKSELDTASQLQKKFSIGYSYTFQPFLGKEITTISHFGHFGHLNSIIAIIKWGDPNEQKNISTSERVFRTVMDRYCRPTNKALKWCYILCSQSGFEVTWQVNDELGTIEKQRIYRAVRPKEWVNFKNFNEYIEKEYIDSTE